MQSNPYPDGDINSQPTERNPEVAPSRPQGPYYPQQRPPYQQDTNSPAQDRERAVRRQDEANTFAYAVGKFMDYLQWVLIVLEVVLALRFFFKLIGADPSNPFASFLYNLSGIFVYPFKGIVSDLFFGSNKAQVFEWSTLIAMVVYALIFWILKLLLRAMVSRPQEPV